MNSYVYGTKPKNIKFKNSVSKRDAKVITSIFPKQAFPQIFLEKGLVCFLGFKVSTELAEISKFIFGA
jgi:hypothetical protein